MVPVSPSGLISSINVIQKNHRKALGLRLDDGVKEIVEGY